MALGRSDLPPLARARSYGDLFLELATVPLDRGWSDYPYLREELEAIADSARGQERMLDALAKHGQLQISREVQLLSGYRRGDRAALDSLYRIFPEARGLIRS